MTLKRLLAFTMIFIQLPLYAAVPTTITDLSATAASNSPAGTDVIGTTLDDFLRIGFAITRRLASNSTVASATTTDIGAVEAEYLSVSGTTTITGLGTIAAGIKRVLVFEGALTLTHNGTSLILPGSASITTAAGDVAGFRSLGSGNWRCEFYSKASGGVTALITVTDGGSGRATGVTPYGLIAVGTTATGVQQTIAPGASNTILVGTGTSSLPLFSTTPHIGAATATTLNGNTITSGTGTLTLSNGSTATFSTSLAFAGTAGTSMTFPATNATIARTDAANTFTGTQTVGALVATTVNGNTLTTGTGTLTLTGNTVATIATTLTLTGTPGTSMTFPTTSATIARTDAANTFTGTQTIGALVATTVTATTVSATQFNGNTITGSSGTLTFAANSVATVSTTMSVGYLGIPQNAQSAGYTLVLGDQGKHIYMQSAGTYTIPANSSVAFPVNTTITFINMNASSTIPITTDTMYLCGAGTTGTRTLAQFGVATAVKMTSTTWLICGSNLTYWKPDNWPVMASNLRWLDAA